MWWLLIAEAGIYTYAYEAERNENCVACSQIPKTLVFHENTRLQEVMEYLSKTYQMKGPGITTTDDNGRNKTLYLPNISSIEERTRPNLKKTLHGKLTNVFEILIKIDVEPLSDPVKLMWSYYVSYPLIIYWLKIAKIILPGGRVVSAATWLFRGLEFDSSRILNFFRRNQESRTIHFSSFLIKFKFLIKLNFFRLDAGC